MPRPLLPLTIVLALLTLAPGLQAAAKSAPHKPKFVPQVYAWVSGTKERALVDLLVRDEDPVLSQLAKKYQSLPSEGEYAPLPDDEPLLAQHHKVGSHLPVVTDRGIVSAKITGYGLGPGASETHVYLVLEPGKRPLQGVAVLTGKPAAGATLAKVARLDPANAEVAARLEHCRAELLAKAPKNIAKILDKLPPAAKTWQMAEGRMPPDFQALVSIAKKRNDTEWFATLLFIDAAGHLKDLLAPPLVSINHYPIERVVDIDGDGIDEFVYRSTYYEGEYFLLLKWDGKAWQVLTLGGDGA